MAFYIHPDTQARIDMLLKSDRDIDMKAIRKRNSRRTTVSEKQKLFSKNPRPEASHETTVG